MRQNTAAVKREEPREDTGMSIFARQPRSAKSSAISRSSLITCHSLLPAPLPEPRRPREPARLRPGQRQQGQFDVRGNGEDASLVDAGLNRRETYARLAAVGERTDGFDAILISHEHIDHVNGLRLLGIDWKAPIYITRLTHQVITWDPKLCAFELFTPGQKFISGGYRSHAVFHSPRRD